MSQVKLLITLLLWSSMSPLLAQEDRFTAGETIKSFGQIAKVNGHQALPEDVAFKISFDVANAAKPKSVNRHIESAARFINMHTAAGVDTDRIDLAIVIHGSAVKDMSKSSHELNVSLISTLQSHGVKFFVCGQSAAYYGVNTEDLLPGVHMSLSAMTAHALLQQQGYTLNPF